MLQRNVFLWVDPPIKIKTFSALLRCFNQRRQVIYLNGDSTLFVCIVPTRLLQVVFFCCCLAAKYFSPLFWTLENMDVWHCWNFYLNVTQFIKFFFLIIGLDTAEPRRWNFPFLGHKLLIDSFFIGLFKTANTAWPRLKVGLKNWFYEFERNKGFSFLRLRRKLKILPCHVLFTV